MCTKCTRKETYRDDQVANGDGSQRLTPRKTNRNHRARKLPRRWTERVRDPIRDIVERRPRPALDRHRVHILVAPSRIRTKLAPQASQGHELAHLAHCGGHFEGGKRGRRVGSEIRASLGLLCVIALEISYHGRCWKHMDNRSWRNDKKQWAFLKLAFLFEMMAMAAEARTRMPQTTDESPAGPCLVAI